MSLNISHERVDKSRAVPHRYPLLLAGAAEVSVRAQPKLSIKTDITFTNYP